VTQHLKLEPSPISQTHVDKVFSPVCNCATNAAHIDFSIRHADHLRIWVRTPSGPSVIADRDFPKGMVHVRWDGHGVPDGVYFAVVRLRDARRTIDLPNPIRVDKTAPVITLVSVVPRVFSPDGDGQSDRVTASYRIDERARAVMLVDARQRVQSKFRRVQGKLVWFGRVNGRTVPAGAYEIRLRAVDRAGNRSARTRAVSVRVRFVELSRERIEVVAGKRFSVRVLTDATSYRWLFARRRGTGTRQVLVLRAPATVGSYSLYVTVGGRAARAAVEVLPGP